MSARTVARDIWAPADLVQHQIISVVASRQKGVPRVVFKGGTLLRICYRHPYRYSEDLDFDWTYQDHSKESIRDFFEDIARKTEGSIQDGGLHTLGCTKAALGVGVTRRAERRHRHRRQATQLLRRRAVDNAVADPGQTRERRRIDSDSGILA